jgi:hypothetical protein
LDCLIDDTKLKCKEAQCIALMHAALSKLKVEAKKQGVGFKERGVSLTSQSCKLYQESLELTKKNSRPSHVVGEAVLSGCMGFRSSQKVVQDGKALLDWQIKYYEELSTTPSSREVWSRIDFEGPSKRITQIRARGVGKVPWQLAEDNTASVSWVVLSPKECVFQVSSAAVGGEFVDVVTFELPILLDSHKTAKQNWTVDVSFRTNKSESWRVAVKTYYYQPVSMAVN